MTGEISLNWVSSLPFSCLQSACVQDSPHLLIPASPSILIPVNFTLFPVTITPWPVRARRKSVIFSSRLALLVALAVALSGVILVNGAGSDVILESFLSVIIVV